MSAGFSLWKIKGGIEMSFHMMHTLFGFMNY